MTARQTLQRAPTCAVPPIGVWAVSLGVLFGTPPALCEEVGIRLSGVVTMGGTPTLAIVETPASGARTARVGDELSGVGLVAGIGPDWVRLETEDGGDLVVRLTGRAGNVPVPAPQTPQAEGGATTDAQDQPPPGELVLVDDELQQWVAALAEDPAAADDVLVPVLREHLHLPADPPVTIMHVDFTEIATATEAVRAMEGGEMIRLQIGSGESEQMLYVRYPKPEEAAAAPPR